MNKERETVFQLKGDITEKNEEIERKRRETGLKNQLGKLTDRPTLRWIFQCFQGIHLLNLNGVEQVVNLTDERSFILEFLPASCHKYYL